MDTRPFDDSPCPCPECRTSPPRVTSQSPLGGAAVNRTPWAVDCPHHGRVHLNNHEYNRQVSATKMEWRCPLCGAEAALSREELQAYILTKHKRGGGARVPAARSW